MIRDNSRSCRVRGCCAWFVRVNRSAEAVRVSDIIHSAGNSVSIGERVRALLGIVLIGYFVTGLLVTVLVEDLVAEFVRLGSVDLLLVMMRSLDGVNIGVSSMRNLMLSRLVFTLVTSFVAIRGGNVAPECEGCGRGCYQSELESQMNSFEYSDP